MKKLLGRFVVAGAVGLWGLAAQAGAVIDWAAETTTGAWSEGSA